MLRREILNETTEEMPWGGSNVTVVSFAAPIVSEYHEPDS
jgi:hypothetical protein